MEVIGAEKLAEAGNVSGVDARRTLADHALDEARSVVKVGGFVAGGDVAQNEQVLNYAASGVVDGIRRTQALNRNTLDQAIAVAMQNRASNDPDGKAAVDSMIEKINQQLQPRSRGQNNQTGVPDFNLRSVGDATLDGLRTGKIPPDQVYNPGVVEYLNKHRDAQAIRLYNGDTATALVYIYDPKDNATTQPGRPVGQEYRGGPNLVIPFPIVPPYVRPREYEGHHHRYDWRTPPAGQRQFNGNGHQWPPYGQGGQQWPPYGQGGKQWRPPY